MSTAILQASNLSFHYVPERPVLDDIVLELSPGERKGLIGGIGSGKTTLLRLFVGLIKPTNGSVVAFGVERNDEKDFVEVRRRIGYVFQDPDDQLFSPTVIDDVAFGPLNLGLDPDAALERARATLESLGITELADRATYRLSGGEKRLVSIATVLAMEPEALLLDEPLTGLDAPSRERVEAVLAALPQAMVVVSHEHGFVERFCASVCRLEDGRLVTD